jgi:hypothetical protein
LRRLGERLEHRRRLRRLARAVPAPPLPAGEGERGGEHGRDDEVAVLPPPGPELGDLFLLFEIEGH